MARTPLNALLTEQSLHLLSVHRGTAVLDLIASDSVEHNFELKNICAKVHPQLADRIDHVCTLLDISKRRFLEAAFIEACDMAESILEAEGVNDFLAALSDEQSKGGE